MVTQLGEYLDQHEIQQRDFAKKLGCSQAVISQWVTGQRRPDLKHAIAIEKETGGAVPAAYWLTITTVAERGRKRRAS